MTVSRSSHVAADDVIAVFSNDWEIFLCVYLPHLLYPFTCRRTFRLSPCPGYCKHLCDEHWSACIFLNYCFLWNVPRTGIAGSCASSIFSFLRNLRTLLCSVRSYIPTDSVGGSPFLHILSRCFGDGHSDHYENLKDSTNWKQTHREITDGCPRGGNKGAKEGKGMRGTNFQW